MSNKRQSNTQKRNVSSVFREKDSNYQFINHGNNREEYEPKLIFLSLILSCFLGFFYFFPNIFPVIFYYALVLIYAIILLLYFIKIPWNSKKLPYIENEDIVEKSNKKFSALIILTIIIGLYILGNVYEQNAYIWMLEFIAIFSILICILLRTEITFRNIIIGIVIGTISTILYILELSEENAFYGTSLDFNAYIGIILQFIAFISSFVAGMVVIQHMSALKMLFLERQKEKTYSSILRSISMGIILGMPVALVFVYNWYININLLWAINGVEIVYGINQAIIENIIINMFFMTWILALLYQRMSTRNAQLLTIIITGIVYHLGYYPLTFIIETFSTNLGVFLQVTFFYFIFSTILPLILYLKRDFESALGFRIIIFTFPLIIAFLSYGLKV